MRIRQLTDFWPADLAILEIDPPNGKVAGALRAAGYTNYLCAAIDQSQLEGIAAGHPGLRDRLAVYHSAKIVRQNNADVLILHRRVASNVALFRPIRHARFVAWEFRPTLVCFFATLIGLLQWILGRLKRPIVLQSTGAPRLIVFPIRHSRPHSGARRFIPRQIGVEGFLRRLQNDNIPHAVLRWFDSLPEIAPGEDLDLLVDDAQLETVRKILAIGIGIQPIDLYSVSGLSGSDFRGLPYYPPNCARQMLDGAIVHRNLCRVPAPREHFLSLAYHAVYHKGSASGLADRACSLPSREKPEHDYHAILASLAARLGLELPITLTDLDAYLDQNGWRPPRETLVRLANHNTWLRSHMAEAGKSQLTASPHFKSGSTANPRRRPGPARKHQNQ
jgi:hypothetical protein